MYTCSQCGYIGVAGPAHSRPDTADTCGHLARVLGAAATDAYSRIRSAYEQQCRVVAMLPEERQANAMHYVELLLVVQTAIADYCTDTGLPSTPEGKQTLAAAMSQIGNDLCMGSLDATAPEQRASALTAHMKRLYLAAKLLGFVAPGQGKSRIVGPDGKPVRNGGRKP